MEKLNRQQVFELIKGRMTNLTDKQLCKLFNDKFADSDSGESMDFRNEQFIITEHNDF